MPDIPPEELGKEIDRLWAKVSASSLEGAEAFAPSPVFEPAGATGVAWEAVEILKRQRRKESRAWAEMMEAREGAIGSLKERQALLEAELRDLRRKAETNESWVVQKTLEAGEQVDAVFAEREAERRRFQEEAGALEALLEKSQERIAALEESLQAREAQWAERARRQMDDAARLQDFAESRRRESLQAAEEAKRASETVREARNALEKTLAELLRERRSREESEKERDRAAKRVGELEAHLQELSRIWEEERRQWGQLWERGKEAKEAERILSQPIPELPPAPAFEDLAAKPEVVAAEEPEAAAPGEEETPPWLPWAEVALWALAAGCAIWLYRLLQGP